MFLEVINAKYIDGYRIFLEFNNGVSKTVDLKNELDGSIFQPLRDIKHFKNFKIPFNTIEWENGADFAPEYLFKIGKD
ncbi:MAG: DUF2442 domain-containing protein [Bacteroidales bacterium]|nr:DUF2442 domain-containing protein [Bacteroidales bacterium]MCF8457617.1 DUF2442 domain-containing protein [Bacteroidales bacterium]